VGDDAEVGEGEITSGVVKTLAESGDGERLAWTPPDHKVN